MTEIQKQCFTCGQQILISKPSPDADWVKTNLDGSAHVDPKGRGSYGKYSPAQQTTIPASTEAAGHKENMEASKELTDAIKDLSSNIAVLSNLVGKYLDNQGADIS